MGAESRREICTPKHAQIRAFRRKLLQLTRGKQTTAHRSCCARSNGQSSSFDARPRPSRSIGGWPWRVTDIEAFRRPANLQRMFQITTQFRPWCARAVLRLTVTLSPSSTSANCSLGSRASTYDRLRDALHLRIQLQAAVEPRTGQGELQNRRLRHAEVRTRFRLSPDCWIRREPWRISQWLTQSPKAHIGLRKRIPT